MALGNANSSVQSRGKNKPVLVKRTKEIWQARDYKAFQGSAVQGSAACGVMNGDVNITYYHNGNNNIPLDTNDLILTRKQKSEEFNVADGYIKVGPDRGRYFSVQVVNGRTVGYTSCS